MPTSFLTADTSFPDLSKEKSTDAKFEKVTNYLYMLLEDLRYTLCNLGLDNINESEFLKIGELITSPIAVQLENDEGQLAQLQITADSLSTRLSDTEGNVSQLAQTAQGLATRVSDAEGNISTLQQTSQGLSTRVSNAEGSISSLTQTANGLSVRVSDAEGNITTIQQTINGLTVTDSGGTTRVKGSMIETGSMVLTGIITWSDLSSGVQNTINEAAETGGVTAQQVTVITKNTISTSEISADQITSGTILADYLDLDGLLALRKNGTLYGYVGATNNASYDAAVLTDSTANYGFIASNGGARMTAREDAEIYVISGTYAGCYSTYEMQVASDARLKSDIKYDMDSCESLFRDLKPCTYQLQKETAQKRHWGFIAQDLEAALSANGFDAGKTAVLGYNGTYYSIGYSEITALNTHMIQRLMERVERLEGKE